VPQSFAQEGCGLFEKNDSVRPRVVECLFFWARRTRRREIPRSSAQGGSLEMTMLFASSFSALAENARTPWMLLREPYFYFTAGVNCVRRFKLPAHSLDC